MYIPSQFIYFEREHCNFLIGLNGRNVINFTRSIVIYTRIRITYICIGTCAIHHILVCVDTHLILLWCIIRVLQLLTLWRRRQRMKKFIRAKPESVITVSAKCIIVSEWLGITTIYNPFYRISFNTNRLLILNIICNVYTMHWNPVQTRLPKYYCSIRLLIIISLMAFIIVITIFNNNSSVLRSSLPQPAKLSVCI